jgi:hypothetical protein
VLVTNDPAPLRDADDGVDVTLIHWMLSLSPEERLAVLQGFADSVAELTHDSPATKVQKHLRFSSAVTLTSSWWVASLPYSAVRRSRP